MNRAGHQTGYILLPVIVVITLVAAIALMMNTESALESNTARSGFDAQKAGYVAAAGLNHALWQTQQQGCGPYSDLVDVDLNSDKYSSKLTSDLGSIVADVAYADQDSWIRNDNPTNNYDTDSKLHIRNEFGDIERPLYRFNLSGLAPKVAVLSATAWFYIEAEHPEGPVEIHQITADWTEADATWDSMGANLGSSILASIPAQPVDDVWVSVNLTGQVQAWANGEPNFGITLSAPVDGVHAEYASRESVNAPYIEVIVGVPPSSPAKLTATGTLGNGVTRDITRNDVVLYQRPAGRLQLQPDAANGSDAEIWDQAPNNNYGAAAQTWVSSGTTDTTRSLLRFNMGALPVGAKILGANLSLQRDFGYGGDKPVSAHRITNAWSEDTVTWNQRETGASWDTAGADFDNTAITTIPVGPVNQRYEWNITPLVQGWVDGSYPNYGVALVAANPGMAGQRFATSDDGFSNRRPRLTVSYSCECGIVCVAPQGGGTILFVVEGLPDLRAREVIYVSVFETMGYSVDLIAEDDMLLDFSSKAATSDVVFVSRYVDSATPGLAPALLGTSLGVVVDKNALVDDLGFGAAVDKKPGSELVALDIEHDITRVFPGDGLRIYDGDMIIRRVTGTASGARVLAQHDGLDTIIALEKNADLGGAAIGLKAVGRRVMLPFIGNDSFDEYSINNNGWLLLQRSLDWASYKKLYVPTYSLLMVVVDPDSLTPQETAKKILIETWDYTVNLIDESDSQANFDAAVAVNDVVYITEDVFSDNVGSKLAYAPIGVVTEEANLADELGFADSIDWSTGTALEIDNTHYITQTLTLGNVTILTAPESLVDLRGGKAPDLQVLGQSTEGPALAVVERGDRLKGIGDAMGRRVILPWGGDDFDVNHLNDDGLAILQRSLAWGVGADLPDFYLDKFPDFSCDGADEYLGTNGTINWSDFAWEELNDDDRACGANLQVMDDPLIDDPSGNRLRLQGSSRGVEREVDLSSFTIARLSFDYRRDGLSGVGTFNVEVSGNGGGNWTTLDSIGAGTDAVYQSAEYDISAYIANDTMIRFWTTSAFTGETYIDNVRIEQSVVAGAPIAHWKLDDGAGLVAIDSEGGHDGSLINWPATPDWVPGLLDGGLSFDGADDYIDVSSMNPMSYDDFTIVAWYRSADTSVSDDEYIFVHDDSFVDEFIFGPTDDGGSTDRLRFGLNLGGAWDPHYGTSDIVDQQWHHLVAVRNDGRIRLYVDGVKETDAVDAHAGLIITIDGDGPFIGDYPGSTEQVHGTLDDLRFYNYALEDTEIDDLYAAGGGGETVDVKVANGNDDAEQLSSDGTMDLTSTDLELADNLSAGGQPSDIVGIRFANLTIPQGEIINNAYIQFQVDELDSGAASLTIEAEAVDDAAQFTTADDDITSRPRTATSVLWTPPAWTTVGERGPAQRSVDISVVVQEIVNRAGWSSGNSLAIIISGTGTRTAEAYDGDPAGAPELHVEYGGGDGCAVRIVDAFNTVGYSGSDGDPLWVGNWVEFGDSGNPTNHDERVVADTTGFKLQIADNDVGGFGGNGEGVWREVDLSAASIATLSFKFQREGLDDGDDAASLYVSGDGGLTWSPELWRTEGPGTDPEFRNADIDISAYLAANTRIRFQTGTGNGGGDRIYFDDVTICAR